MPRRIAFINEKGGSGKTTLVANLAAYLALERGRHVLAIDMDPQGQLGKVLGLEAREPRNTAIELLVDTLLGSEAPAREGAPEQGASGHSAPRTKPLPVRKTRIPNLDVIVSNKALALFPTWTQPGGGEGMPDAEDDPTSKLRDCLDRAPEIPTYDFVLFDAPPSFGPLTLNVLRAADELVVPVPLTYLALDGTAELMRTVQMVRDVYGHKSLTVSMVIPTFHRRTRLANEVLDSLKRRFPKEIAQTVLGVYVKIDEAQSRGLSVFEHAPRDRGALSMAALAEELETRGRIPTSDAEADAPERTPGGWTRRVRADRSGPTSGHGPPPPSTGS